MSNELQQQLHNLKLVSEPTTKVLNNKEVIDYRAARKNRAKWYLSMGKEPVRATGYSPTTLKSRLSNLDKFFRFVWKNNGGYSSSSSVSHDDADDYVQEIIYKDVTDQYRANVQKSLKMYFKYVAHGGGTSVEDTSLLWEPTVKFSQYSSATVARDYFTKEELREVRSAALSYGSPPHYNALSPDKRDEWKTRLSQRYEIPKDDVGPQTFKRADGFKTASLVCTSLDTGLRPVEVGRASTEWFDADHNALLIPKQDGTKNDETWEVALTESTTTIVGEWIEERELYEKYDGRDNLWLTKYGNPYGAESLSDLLRRICSDTSIDVEERQLTWYSIRRGVASLLANNGSVAEAQYQLRHKSPKTTMRYVSSGTDARRTTLENNL